MAETRSKSISSKVTPTQYKQCQLIADAAGAGSVSEWNRLLVERELAGAQQPAQLALMAEVWAARFSAVNALLDVVEIVFPDHLVAAKRKLEALKAEADSKKLAKALALLGGRP
jgi:hypothetical protein